MNKLLLTTTILAAIGAAPANAANVALILWNGPAVETATGFGSTSLVSSSLGGVTVTLSFANRSTSPNQLTEGNINIDNTTSTVQTLHMIVGANGFLGPSFGFGLTGGIVGTNGSSDVTGSYFVDSSNSLNGQTEFITGLGIGAFDSGALNGVQSFSFNGLGSDAVLGPYGLAERLDLVLQPFSGVAVQAISMTASPVPEPKTWAMLGLGFAVMAFFGVKRRKDRLSNTFA